MADTIPQIIATAVDGVIANRLNQMVDRLEARIAELEERIVDLAMSAPASSIPATVVIENATIEGKFTGAGVSDVQVGDGTA